MNFASRLTMKTTVQTPHMIFHRTNCRLCMLFILINFETFKYRRLFLNVYTPHRLQVTIKVELKSDKIDKKLSDSIDKKYCNYSLYKCTTSGTHVNRYI